MNSDSNNGRRIVGLQIGGTVGPNDQVGMHIPMPTIPGIGVKVELGNEIDTTAKEISSSIPSDHPKAVQIKAMVDEILAAKDKESKLKKVHTLVMIGAGVTQIAVGIGKITKLLGY